MLISLGSGTLANLPNQAKLLGKLRGRSDQKLAEKRNFFFWKLTVDSDEGSWCRGLTCLPVTEEIAGSNPVGPARNYDAIHRMVF
jgi:hypothetical protein